MDYIPHTDSEIAQMLQEIGAADFEQLLLDIPKQFRVNSTHRIDLPEPLGEQELRRVVLGLSNKNYQHKHYRLYLAPGPMSTLFPVPYNTSRCAENFLRPTRRISRRRARGHCRPYTNINP